MATGGSLKDRALSLASWERVLWSLRRRVGSVGPWGQQARSRRTHLGWMDEGDDYDMMMVISYVSVYVW